MQQWPDPQQGLLGPMLLRLNCAGEQDGFIFDLKTEMYHTKLVGETQDMPSFFSSEVMKCQYAGRPCTY